MRVIGIVGFVVCVLVGCAIAGFCALLIALN
jgi:hypothetical protein